jgi:hypothetical protein
VLELVQSRKETMKNSNHLISIFYHEKSSDWLNSSEEEIFANQVCDYGCKLNFDHPELKTKRALPKATIGADDVRTVVLVIVGIVGTTILQEFVKDLYGGLKKILEKRKKINIQKHQQFAEIRFAVFFEYWDQEKLNKVALEYKDEETFRISFYRLDEYIKDPKNKKKDRYFELEYPKWGNLYYIFPFGLGPLIMLGILVGYILEEHGIIFSPPILELFCMFVFPAVVLLAISLGIYVRRKRVYLKKYFDNAIKWENDIKSSSSETSDTE